MRGALLCALLTACGGDDPTPADTAEEPGFAPSFGPWDIHIGDTWGGDCALDDANTYQKADQPWTLRAYHQGFSIMDEVGYWSQCTLDGMDFVCDLPIIADDFRDLGYDIQATYTPTWVGSFSDADTLTGSYALLAECEGDDCNLMTGYGEDLRFPCTAQTPLEGTFSPRQ